MTGQSPWRRWLLRRQAANPMGSPIATTAARLDNRNTSEPESIPKGDTSEGHRGPNGITPAPDAPR